jgi:hypothetical protein
MLDVECGAAMQLKHLTISTCKLINNNIGNYACYYQSMLCIYQTSAEFVIY